MALQEGGHSFY